MKKNKLLFQLFLLSLTGLTLTSCSLDNDEIIYSPSNSRPSDIFDRPSAKTDTDIKDISNISITENSSNDDSQTPTHVHVFDIETVTSYPSCTSPGKKKVICKCGAYEEVKIEPLGHSLKTTEISDESYVYLSFSMNFEIKESEADYYEEEYFSDDYYGTMYLTLPKDMTFANNGIPNNSHDISESFYNTTAMVNRSYFKQGYKYPLEGKFEKVFSEILKTYDISDKNILNGVDIKKLYEIHYDDEITAQTFCGIYDTGEYVYESVVNHDDYNSGIKMKFRLYLGKTNIFKKQVYECTRCSYSTEEMTEIDG